MLFAPALSLILCTKLDDCGKSVLKSAVYGGSGLHEALGQLAYRVFDDFGPTVSWITLSYRFGGAFDELFDCIGKEGLLGGAWWSHLPKLAKGPHELFGMDVVEVWFSDEIGP